MSKVIKHRCSKEWAQVNLCGEVGIFFAFLLIIANSSNAVMVRVDVSFVDDNTALVSGYLDIQESESISGVQMDISITPEGWSLVELISGEVAENAGKEVYASVIGEVVRILVIGFNNQTMTSGQMFSILIGLSETTFPRDTKIVVLHTVFSSPDGKAVDGASVVEQDNDSFVGGVEGEKLNSDNGQAGNTNSTDRGNQETVGNDPTATGGAQETIGSNDSLGYVRGISNQQNSNTVLSSNSSESSKSYEGYYAEGFVPYLGEDYQVVISGRSKSSDGKEIFVGLGGNVVVAKDTVSERQELVPTGSGSYYNGFARLESLSMQNREANPSGRGSKVSLLPKVGKEIYSSLDVKKNWEGYLLVPISSPERDTETEIELSKNFYTPGTRRQEWIKTKMFDLRENGSVDQKVYGFVPFTIFITIVLIVVSLVPRMIGLLERKILGG